MFGQEKRLRKRLAQFGVNVDEFRSISQVADDVARNAPSQFPDGEPFEAREHQHRLAQATMAVLQQGSPDSSTIAGHITLLMELLRDPHEPVEPALIDAVEDSARTLTERGIREGATAMQDALAAYRRFQAD